jgi:hypothetical protein
MPSMMSTFQFPEAYIVFLNRMNFLNIDMLSILGAQCVFDVDFRYSMLGSLMIPIVVVCTTGIFYACKSAGIHSNMKTMTKIEQMKTYGRLFDLGDYNESGSIDFEVSGGFVVVFFLTAFYFKFSLFFYPTTILFFNSSGILYNDESRHARQIKKTRVCHVTSTLGWSKSKN